MTLSDVVVLAAMVVSVTAAAVTWWLNGQIEKDWRLEREGRKAMRYEYECPVHGEVELDHPMTADRKGQRCPRTVMVRVRSEEELRTGVDTPGPAPHVHGTCNEPLKPLISARPELRDMPANFVGRGWTRREGDSYRNAGTIELRKGATTEEYRAALKEARNKERANFRGPVST